MGGGVKDTLGEVGVALGAEVVEETPPEDDTYLATDADFEWVPEVYYTSYEAVNETEKGYYYYIGNEREVKIPHEINGHPMTNYYNMFHHTSVKKVVSTNPNITSMHTMFWMSFNTSLDLSNFDTSSVKSMDQMFVGARAKTLDLSKFNTSNVTNMSSMFRGASASSR